MKTNFTETLVKGKTVHIPSTCIHGCLVFILGRLMRVAIIAHEEWLEKDAVENPDCFIAELKTLRPKVDMFTFSQKLPNTIPRFEFHTEWDSFAVIPITTFVDWCQNRVPKDVRQNIKKAKKIGVDVREVEFNDELVAGIKMIYDETPVRQGTRFSHYRKDFETIKKELSTYLNRSRFIGAYFQGKLIGFVELVQMGRVADIMQILCSKEHHNKKTANALLACTVEICAKNGMSHLVYGRYADGNKKKSSLIDFKRRNGFLEVLLPRYYIPLTTRGKIFLRLGLHHGVKGILPRKIIDLVVNLRSYINYLWCDKNAIGAQVSRMPKEESTEES